jgi:hypothetical protein
MWMQKACLSIDEGKKLCLLTNRHTASRVDIWRPAMLDVILKACDGTSVEFTDLWSFSRQFK